MTALKRRKGTYALGGGVSGGECRLVYVHGNAVVKIRDAMA